MNLIFNGFGRFGEKIKIYIEMEAQEQHSLIDTIFNYIFHFGPPGKYLYLRPQNPLSVGRRDHRVSRLVYRYVPEAPK